MPAEGRPKDPNTPPERRASPKLKEAGRAAGIAFTGLTDRYPNSAVFHTLMSYVLENDGAAVQHALADVAFRHYFTDGKYPNADNLRAAAIEAKVSDPDAALKYAFETRNQAPVKIEAQQYSRQGVRGVPFFLINGKAAGSGAMAPSSFKALIREELCSP